MVPASIGGGNGNLIGPTKPARNAHLAHPSQPLSNSCLTRLAASGSIWRSLWSGVRFATGLLIKAFPALSFTQGSEEAYDAHPAEPLSHEVVVSSACRDESGAFRVARRP